MKKFITGFTKLIFTKLNIAFVVSILFCLFISSVSSQPLQLGQSVVTHFQDNNLNNYVVRIIDLRNKPPFVVGGFRWNPYQFSGADWNYATLGSVFGVTLDDNPSPNIFVSRTTAYCFNDYILRPDSAIIYRLDGGDWGVSTYIRCRNIPGPPQINVNWIPNTGPGLGNLCYDNWHKQIFVTNHEDGRIYRIKDNSGVGEVKSWYDPLNADSNTIGGFAPMGERLWGIGTYGTNISDVRVYFSKWRFDRARPNTSGQYNEIWSIALTSSGEFDPSTIKPEIYLPKLPDSTYSNPCSDIEFSFKGDMLCGERTMAGNMSNCAVSPGGWAHKSRILEYVRDINGNYPNFIWHKVGLVNPPLGIHFKSNSSGGVDFQYGISDSVTNVNNECDSIIVGTGDYLLYQNSFYVYGLQVTERSSAGINNVEDFSHFIDINGDNNKYDKTMQGDVDVYRKDLCSDTNTCMSIIRDTVYCDSTETYIYEFQIRNNSYTKSIEQLEIGIDSPQPPDYVVAVPSTINTVIPPRGASQVYRVKLIGPGANAYAEVCYTLSALFEHDDCPWCCYIENCIKLPICSCAEVLQDSVYYSNNQYNYNFTLQNGTEYNVTKIQLTSPGINQITFVPQIFHFTIPIVPGQDFPNLTAQILGGAAGMTIPVRIKLFSNDFECCYIENDISLPFTDCTQSLIYDSLNCINGQLGQYISLQNSTTCNITRVELFSSGPNPISFVPQTYNFGTPILPGQLFPVLNTQTNGSAVGSTYTVRIKLFSNDIECCYIDYTYIQLSCSKIISHGRYLNLKAFIEGRYNPVLNLMTGGEIQVELRNNYSPYALVETAAGYLDETGNSTLQFFNAENGVNYYIVIKNSNTIETWSKSPGQSFTNDVLNFDFLTEDQAYGNNLGLIDSDPVRYGIHSGDVDQDRQVDISDISVIFNDSKTFTTGASDLNGDGVTDLTDLMIAFNNATNYVSVVRP